MAENEDELDIRHIATAFTEQDFRGAMRQVHEDRLRDLPRQLHHRRPEGNLLDGRLAEGRGAADLRRRENRRGGHSGTSRINPQGDIGTTGIRQGQEGGVFRRSTEQDVNDFELDAITEVHNGRTRQTESEIYSR